jgi:hypothetical protein
MGFKIYGKTAKQIRARADKLRGKGNYRLGKLHKHTKADGTKTKYALILKKKGRKKNKVKRKKAKR